MKKYIYILTLVIPSFFFTSCTESDDEFFASTVVTANNLIELDVTGNEVNVSCYVARLLPQSTNPFDIYLTSTSRKMFFNYTLEKRNTNGAWEFITPSTLTVIETVSKVTRFVDPPVGGETSLNCKFKL